MRMNLVRRFTLPLQLGFKNRADNLSRFQVVPVRQYADERPVPKNVIGHIYSASSQPKNGKVYDRKPFKIRLYPNKQYHWCLCGLSKNQPMCDGSHKLPHMKCDLKPIKFEVEDEDDYWLCNCKQTKLRPFCDGSHKKL